MAKKKSFQVGDLVTPTQRYMQSVGMMRRVDGVVVGVTTLGGDRPMLYVVWSDDEEGLPRPILASEVQAKRTNRSKDDLLMAATQASGGLPYGESRPAWGAFIREEGRWTVTSATDPFDPYPRSASLRSFAESVADAIYEDRRSQHEVVLLDPDGSVALRLPAIDAEGNPSRKSSETWWAHALGGVSVLSIGPFSSSAAAKKYLRDRGHDHGPFRSDGAGAWAGENFIVDQRTPGPRRDVSSPVTSSNPRTSGEAKRCGEGELKIHRKGYRRSDGTRVAATTFCAPDRGAEGRGPDIIPTPRPGSLGGPGYTSKSAAARHKILKEHVRKYGYASTIATLQSRINLGHRTMGKKALAAFRADKKWVQSNFEGKSGNPDCYDKYGNLIGRDFVESDLPPGHIYDDRGEAIDRDGPIPHRIYDEYGELIERNPRGERTVTIYEVLHDTTGSGPTGDGTVIARFRNKREAEAFAARNTLYGSQATADERDVPVRLARRWGVANPSRNPELRIAKRLANPF